MQIALAASVLGLLGLASADTYFLNPAPWYLNNNYSKNYVYDEGEVLNIAWMSGNESEPAALYMYQVSETTLESFGTNEMIVEDLINTTNYEWLVKTTKNLTDSNLFIISIYQAIQCCDYGADNSTVVFNISSDAAAATVTKTVSPASQTAAATGSAGSSSSSSSGSGLSGGAKVGITAGVLAAALVAAAAFFFLWGRRRGRRGPPPGAAAAGQGYGGPGPAYDHQKTGSPGVLSGYTDASQRTPPVPYYHHLQQMQQQQQQQQQGGAGPAAAFAAPPQAGVFREADMGWPMGGGGPPVISEVHGQPKVVHELNDESAAPHTQMDTSADTSRNTY